MIYDAKDVVVTFTDEDGTRRELKGLADPPPSPSKRKPCHCEEIGDLERLFDAVCVDCPRRGISVVTILGTFD